MRGSIGRVMRWMLVIMLVGGWARGADYIWWEAESPAVTNFTKGSYFSADTFASTRHLLSRGDWLSINGKQEAGKPAPFAKFRFEVGKDGEYNLWCRKFWQHGPFRWRFDNGKWTTCGKDVALADETILRTNICANWVYLGAVTPKKGMTTFEIQLIASEDEEWAAAFDCFLLIPGAFVPNGSAKPDQKTGSADEGFFAWEPGMDPFNASAIDLRYLNEEEAGKNGPIKRNGDKLTLGDGRVVKLFGIDIGPNNFRQNHASIDFLARKLAKLGVNAVRCHGAVFDLNADPRTADMPDLDHLMYLVSSLKKQGIYTTISFYFPMFFELGPSSGFPEYSSIGNKRPFALLYFHPRMQEIYRIWVRRMLTTKSPYTGLTLAADPSVGMIEIVNEDSLFFWTLSKENIPAADWELLERRFGQWLKQQYGSTLQAIKVWGDEAREKGDDAGLGRMTILPAWSITREGIKAASPAKRNRIADQVRFFTDIQRQTYASMAEYFKTELKFGGLVVASNWYTADNALLDPLERYTYTAGDVIDQHGYFTTPHAGDGSGHQVRQGNTFTSISALTAPEKLEMRVNQVEGFPQTMSELGFSAPNRFRAEATILTSAIASIQGIDGLNYFAVTSNYVRDLTMQKMSVSSPVMCATFPAAALMYRRGDVKEGPVVFKQSIRPEEIFAQIQSGTFDTPEADAISFFRGRVVRSFDKTSTPIASGTIDKQAKTIESADGEMKWDVGAGLLRIDTPRTQGVAGFLSRAGKVELANVSVESGNEYASVVVTALDHRPIGESKRLLIQTMTEDRPFGFKTEGDKITALGGSPYNVRKIDARVTIKGEGELKVVGLDENGYARSKKVEVNARNVTIPADCVYMIVTR